jgi:hypothetical protein
METTEAHALLGLRQSFRFLDGIFSKSLRGIDKDASDQQARAQKKRRRSRSPAALNPFKPEGEA